MNYLLLDDARDKHARLYQDHIRRDTISADKIEQLDVLLNYGWEKGLHATLTIPYEFGYTLVGLHPTSPPLLLDWYGRLEYLNGTDIDDWLHKQHQHAPSGLINLHFDTSLATYTQAIEDIQEQIRAGNTYQINYTLRLHGESYGNPVALYQRLRAQQPAPYAALAYHPDDGYTLCLSPELFLARDGTQIYTLPMKGTARAEGDIEAAKSILAHDPKNRAENTMIVDLLRNDLSKLAKPHSVRVTDPFHVEQHGQVLQMTSRINAELHPQICYSDILSATFPCGSITGAPKRITMQFIEALESSPRKLYTGAIGYIEPQKMCLNVAIRTLSIHDHQATFGVGSGITIDSDAEDEYQECQLKAAFLHLPAEVGLIETLRIEDGIPQDLELHLKRLSSSAAALNIPCDLSAIRHHLAHLPQAKGKQRLRIDLAPDGKWHITITPLTALPNHITCIIHPVSLPDHDPLRRYKSTHRCHFDQAWQQAEIQGAFDALIFNESGYLLEGGRSNIFIQINREWHTPPLTLDILPGIARTKILAYPELLHTDTIHETLLTHSDLIHADRIILVNSLRGILHATLQNSTTLAT
ncbi:MAG: bifunctional anthranilate synthase component I family protein/class IV aminotransferase [Cardiobacteriaceae bacterium]|nr:bifunctional anthranilate synthase component I family protein/class IV aminotransferase [Cardiobacteriaceae bacterium]